MGKITPLIKGLITGTLMLIATLYIYYAKLPASNNVQYLIYIVYAAGILWTLIEFSRTPSFTGKFSELFSQGFRCFIVVTLIMVAFIGFFSAAHPEMADEAAQYYREGLVKEGNRQPAEIDEMVTKAKKQFTVGNMSIAIFGYLISGTIFTLAGSALVLLRRRQR